MRCHACNSEMTCQFGEYHYVESGLDNVYLTDVEIWSCPCGEEVVGIPKVPALHTLIAQDILGKRSPLAPEEIRFLRKNLAMPAKDLADLVGVDPATVSRWEHGKQVPNSATDRLVRVIYAIEKDLSPKDLVDGFHGIGSGPILTFVIRIEREKWSEIGAE